MTEEWLVQEDVHEDFLALGRGPWTVVYRSLYVSKHEDLGIYCAFAPTDYRERALSDPGWDLMVTDGRPGFSQGSGERGELVTTYHRLGDDGVVEPLVLHREFYGSHPGYLEIVQEFRLFHNLYWDDERHTLMKAREDGTAKVAVEVSEDEVRVKTKLLRQYQAARQLDLLLFIDSRRYAGSAGEALPEEKKWRTDELCATRYPNTLLSPPITRYLATRAILPPPVERSGIWPYEEVDDHFPDFAIGYDEEGEEVRLSCNPGLENLLTPVFFTRDVLYKYYDNPERYTVEDGALRCSGSWMLKIDNDVPDHVVVFLGDLGRALPKSERDYWRSFNVAPEGTMSQTGMRRAFLGEPAEAQVPDLKVRAMYRRLVEDWKKQKGWALFREPTGPDAKLLQRLRVPLNESQVEFEESLDILAKLLSDGLNDKEIKSRLQSPVRDEKSISKFERWLRQEGYGHADRDVKLLRDVQELRSKVAAHRKSADYEKTLDSVLGDLRGRAAIVELLERVALFLRSLREWHLEDK